MISAVYQAGSHSAAPKSDRLLADTGAYPSGQTIADALGVINKLLAETESLGLIGRFLERKDDLHDLSDEVHELTNFYTTQRPAWDKLRQAQTRFQPNRDWLDQNDTAAKALTRIKEILSAAAPYGLIKEADALIQTVERVNDALVAQRRDQILPGIDTQLAKIQVELDDAKASADLRNRCRYPLQQIKGQVGEQTSIAHIAQAAARAVELADAAFARIEAAGPPVQPLVHDHDDAPSKATVKPRRVVRAAALAPKTYLETQADVDAYLDKLRKTLESAIGNHERVEIR